MYPKLFGIIPSYEAALVVGVLAAVALFRLFADKTKLSAKVYNYYSLDAVISIAVGLASAMLFQSVYNFIETGVFRLQGMTFMGGLIGGAACFTIIALLARDEDVKKSFFSVAELAAPCVCLAHAIGRIGCTLHGCCYGKPSEYGWLFQGVGEKVIPTQFIEACFLFALFAVLTVSTVRRKPNGFNLIIYCLAYSVFRFVVEFFRGDPRGSFVGALSPSQFQSLVLLAIGIALLVLRLKRSDIYLFKAKGNGEINEKRTHENIEENAESDDDLGE